MSGGSSHKRKSKAPKLTVGATSSQIVSHGDGRRLRARVGVVGDDAGLAGPEVGRYWADDLATNLAREDPSFTYRLGDDSLSSLPDDVPDGISVVLPPKGANRERPLKTWYPHCDEYVEENIRLEGRGSAKTYAKCRGVHCQEPHQEGYRGCTGVAEYRCSNQACFGEVMQCARCIVAGHARLPTHFIEKWTGKRFKRMRTGLRDLGLRVQLNHPPGVVCPYKHSAPHDFVLYDVSGVHELGLDFCGCETENQGPPLPTRVQMLRACWWPATVSNPNTCATFAVLRLFQVLNCLGKLSAYDFLRGLEMTTNHDGLDKPPDRRRPFMHIMRQWREVKRHKRAKRGHKPGGTGATQQGELALKCRACPQPGWNLPEGWENAPPGIRFLYWLFLAMDANFRLSNRNVSSEEADPIIGDGWGFFCKREGDDGYKEHIRKHVNDKEISNCSGFMAMFMANSRRAKGLRTTGLGGVTCSRHNMWCANGMGDLQMGERYCNMDFLIISVLVTFQLLCLVASYDIACQYAIHFFERMAAFPPAMRLSLKPENVWWKVPNFHLPGHKPPCHSAYSFHWMLGAGMTHGEGVEQNWSSSNGAAPSTRLMGPGSRHATLEDIFGFHNYDRQLAMHRVLPKRLAISMKEGLKHNAAFEEFSTALEALRPEEVAEWRAWVHRWESKQQTDSSDSPFDLVEEGAWSRNSDSRITLRAIQLQIAEEEFLCTDDGVEVEQEHSPGAFITMGLAIEEQQRRLEIDVKALRDPTPAQKLGFAKRRTTMLKRIHKFREIQRIYMPALRAVLSDEQKQVFDGNGEQLPEATRLFMPSELASAVMRGNACAIGLAEVEARMREGETSEALEGVRQGLRTRTMTNRYKLRNYTGQGQMTRGQGILRLINIRIHMAKLRYRYARAALLALRGHGAWEDRLRILADDDVRALNERALTLEEKAQNEHWAELAGAIIEGGVARAGAVAAGEGSHTLSWIWYTVGVTADDNDPRLHDALRVEWSKAYSRARRYDEDVRLLREEMRRTIAAGVSEAEDWERLSADDLPGASAELTEGRRAYATERAETERETCAKLTADWAPILARADGYLAGREGEDGGGVPVTIELELGDELDAEEDEARLEAEEEDGPDGTVLRL